MTDEPAITPIFVYLSSRLISTCTPCVSLMRRWRTSWAASAGRWRMGLVVTQTPRPQWRCCPPSSGPSLMDQVGLCLVIALQYPPIDPISGVHNTVTRMLLFKKRIQMPHRCYCCAFMILLEPKSCVFLFIEMCWDIEMESSVLWPNPSVLWICSGLNHYCFGVEASLESLITSSAYYRKYDFNQIKTSIALKEYFVFGYIL